MAQARADEAVTHYERALALNPDHVLAHINLSAALATQGRMDEAAAHHDRALVLSPKHAEAHNERGNIL